MRRLILLLLFATAVWAQDPLGATYKPSIDTTCTDYPSNVWVSGPLWKIRQDSGSAPACTNGMAENGKWYTAFGTQNEFIDFQIHWHDTGSGTTGLKITVSNFVQTSPHSSTINCSTLGQCIIYREAYLDVTPVSSVAATYFGAPGIYPDTLIPTTDPYYNQTTNAWPFTVAANQNQSAWIDVLIPASAPSGYYSGTVTIQTGCPSSCSTVTTLPVILAVWQWPSSGNMPSTPTLKMEMAGFGYNGLNTQMYSPNASTTYTSCTTYPNASTNDSCNTQEFADGALILKDHRSPMGGAASNIFPGTGSFSSYVTVGGFSFSGACRYTGGPCPTLPSASINTAGLSDLSNTSAVWSNWRTNYQSNSWLSALGQLPLFFYLCDEPPNGCSWSTLNTNATTYHGYFTTGVPLLVTTNYASANSNSALNSIDIMVVEQVDYDITQASNYATWVAGSTDNIPRHLWSYSDCQEADSCANTTSPTGVTTRTYPNHHIDGLPVSNRAQEWLTFLHSQTGELYYAPDICTVPISQGANCGTNQLWPIASGGAVVNSAGTAITWTVDNNDSQQVAIQAGQTFSVTNMLNSAFNASSYTVSSHTATTFITNNPNSVAANTSSGCASSPGIGTHCITVNPTYDPWKNLFYSGAWGDGTLVQAGQGSVSSADNYMGTGVTKPIILPTMRLKLQRDGVQDYEYLNVLTNNGKGSTVTSALASWMSSSTSFNTNPIAAAGGFSSDITDARNLLGTAMHQLTFPPAPPAVYVAQTAGTFSGCTGGACACNGQTAITPSSITWASGTTYVMCGTITFGTNVTGMTISASGTSSAPIIIQFDTNAILQSPQFAGCTDGPGGGSSAAGGAINTNGQSYIIIDGMNTGTIQNTANGNTLTNDTCTVLLYLNGDNIIVRNLTLQNAYQWPSGAAADNNGTNTGDIYANVTNYLKICNNTISNAALGAELNFNYAGGVTPGTIEGCNGNTFTAGNFNIANNTWVDHAWVAHFNGAGVPLIYGNDLMPAPSWQNWKNTTAHTDGWFFVGNSAATFQPQVFWNMFRGDIQSSSPTAMLFTTDDGVASSGKGAALAIYGNIFYGQGSTVLCCQGIGYQATSGDPKGPFAIYNNTFVNTAFPNELYTQAAGTPTVDWRNNIYWLNATSQNAYFYQNQDGGWTFGASVTVNGNDYFGGRALPFGIFISPSTFATWKASCTSGSAHLCDASSITNDPTLFSEGSFGSGTTIADGSGFYETVTSPTRNLGDNLTSKCTTLVGLCTSPPQHFGVSSSCGTGCTSRPATGQWDTGAYQFVNITPTTNAPAVLFVKEF